MCVNYSRPVVFAAALLFIFFLSSCIGIKTGISIKNDGSGTIGLVYTIADSLDSMGRQDGNISQPPLPVSKSDFEKTVSRIDGLSLRSYKSETDGSDLLVTVNIHFDNLDSLAAFLDESGQTFSYTETNGKKELVFSFIDFPSNVEDHERELFSNVLEGYRYEFEVETQGNIDASFIDQNGNPLSNPAFGNLETQSGSVSFALPMSSLVFAEEPVKLKVTF